MEMSPAACTHRRDEGKISNTGRSRINGPEAQWTVRRLNAGPARPPFQRSPNRRRRLAVRGFQEPGKWPAYHHWLLAGSVGV